MQNEGVEMTAPGPGRGKPIPAQCAGQHGEVAVRMTAFDIYSLAINFAQNDWPLDGWDSPAMREVLNEIYERLLEGSRKAVERRMAKRIR